MSLKTFIASMDDMSFVELQIALELLKERVASGSIKKRIKSITKLSSRVVDRSLGTNYYHYVITYEGINHPYSVTMSVEGAYFLAEAFGISIVESVS